MMGRALTGSDEAAEAAEAAEARKVSERERRGNC